MSEGKELLIRKATPDDVNQIAKLELICFSDPWTEEAIHDDVVVNPASTYIVAELEGRIVGYIGFWCIIDECQINNVAVAPALRNQGVGALLLDTALVSTEDAGMKYWNLEVRVGNQPAIKLYEQAGFVTAGLRKKYYANGEDALLMNRYKDKEEIKN